MLTLALLAAVESGLNRVLRMDATALPRLASLAGKVIAIECHDLPLQLFLLADREGLRLAGEWQAAPDCRLRASSTQLLRLGLSREKTRVLHEPDVELFGDANALLELAGILQDLELDWEYELSRWIGPLAAGVLGSRLRGGLRWTRKSLASLRLNLADYLAEESRALVGRREAEARFAEIEDAALRLDRLEARLQRLTRPKQAADDGEGA